VTVKGKKFPAHMPTSQRYVSAIDSWSICSLEDLLSVINPATGWQYMLHSFMLLGDRRQPHESLHRAGGLLRQGRRAAAAAARRDQGRIATQRRGPGQPPRRHLRQHQQDDCLSLIVRGFALSGYLGVYKLNAVLNGVRFAHQSGSLNWAAWRFTVGEGYV
jgi:hypothetical protein